MWSPYAAIVETAPGSCWQSQMTSYTDPSYSRLTHCYQVWRFCLSESCSGGSFLQCNLSSWLHFPTTKNVKPSIIFYEILRGHPVPDRPQLSQRELWQCMRIPHPHQTSHQDTWHLWPQEMLNNCSISFLFWNISEKISTIFDILPHILSSTLQIIFVNSFRNIICWNGWPWVT